MSVTFATHYPSSAGQKLYTDIRTPSSLVWRSIVIFSLLGLLCFALQLFDHRLINGANVWEKPAKFFLAVALQFATVSWASSFLPAAKCSPTKTL